MFAPKSDLARTDIGRTDITRMEVDRTGCLIMRGVVADAKGKDDQLRQFFFKCQCFTPIRLT
jgi:hypothetical protein